MDIRQHLVITRDDLAEIETLSRSLGNEPSLEEIESMVRKRDTLVARMKQSERRLSQHGAQWNRQVDKDPFLKSLFEESRALLSSVSDFDSRLASCIESRMAAVKKQLTALYHSSRAAYSYTAHSILRTARSAV